MEKQRKVQGYLECDDQIIRINSFDEIEEFVLQFGKTVSDISEVELDQLAAKKDGKVIQDDCLVEYLVNPLILKKGQPYIDNRIKEGTIAISDEAYVFNYDDRCTLKSVYMPDTIKVIGNSAFRNNQRLKKVRLPNDLLKIGNSAFSWCLALAEITLPPKIKYIGAFAFNQTAITQVSIPTSVQHIGSMAFQECYNLTKVLFQGVPTEIGSGIFSNCKQLAEIIVPAGKKGYFLDKLYPINENIIKEC